MVKQVTAKKTAAKKPKKPSTAAASAASAVSLSQVDVEDHLLEYFTGRFPAIPASNISAGTDLKTLYGFNDNSWAALALTLNVLTWMRQLNVRLAPAEMQDATTLGQLSTLIWKKVKKVVG
jgi:hypothetical protein